MGRKQIREKAHRLAREFYQGEVAASITICVQERVPLFTDAGLVAEFVRTLGDASDRYSCLVLVYCFMPDHVHLVLCGTNPNADLWKAVVDFKQRSGFWLARHRPGVLWQKDFHDRIMREGDDLPAHVRYILDNPCRKGIVEDWEEYPYKGSTGCRLEEVLAGLPL